jgi:D-alanine-D-alanine ligase
LRSLILSYPCKERLAEDKNRFNDMTSQLRKGGIEAKYVFTQSYDQLVDILDHEKADIVFPATYYVARQSSKRLNIARVLDEKRIPYIGSSADALELVLSKSSLKEHWQQNLVRTPEFCTVQKDEAIEEKIKSLLESTPFPFIIKPDREGNSRGLDESSIVFNYKSLHSKGEKLLSTYDRILVEKYLGDEPHIREYTIAMIGTNEHMLIMPARISLKVKHRHRIVTTQDKDFHNTLARPVTDLNLRAQLTDFARRAFLVAGVRDYARLDVMLTGGNLYAIEINGQPMVPDKWFEACTQGFDLNKAQYINAIFFAGIKRCIRAGYPDLEISEKMIKLLPEKIRSILADQ